MLINWNGTVSRVPLICEDSPTDSSLSPGYPGISQSQSRNSRLKNAGILWELMSYGTVPVVPAEIGFNPLCQSLKMKFLEAYRKKISMLNKVYSHFQFNGKFRAENETLLPSW